MINNKALSVPMGDAAALRPGPVSGWHTGLGNLLRKENRQWWSGKHWLIQALVWLVIINGLVAFVVFVMPGFAGLAGDSEVAALDPILTGLQGLFQLGLTALAIGVIIMTQDSVIGERQSGVTEWILSKPVARPAYLLAKLAANTTGALVILVGLQSAVAYGLLALANGSPLAPLPYLAGVGILALHTFFYLSLTLMMGVLAENRSLVLGVPLGIALGGMLIPSLLPAPLTKVLLVTPVLFPNFAPAVAYGMAVPANMIALPLISTALFSLLFVGLALWKFQKMEF